MHNLIIKYKSPPNNTARHAPKKPSAIPKLAEYNKYFNLYNKCIKMLSTKLKSTYSIRKYLEKELEDEDITKIIEKLTSIGLLDDIVYTKAYIKDKINFTTQGPNKIYNDLIDEDINENIILEELKNIDKTT